MKRMLKSIGLLVICLIMTLNTVGCELSLNINEKPKTDEDMITERVNKFITACNAGDAEGALDCFDAKSRTVSKAALNIGNGLFGSLIGVSINIEDILALAIGMSGDDILSMKILSIEIESETSAKVMLSVEAPDSNGNSEQAPDYVLLRMVKENGDWYIDAQYGLDEEFQW